ncbi:MAG: hypothetical protein JXQ99_05185 [Hyphomicrobiaceae bacterium]
MHSSNFFSLRLGLLAGAMCVSATAILMFSAEANDKTKTETKTETWGAAGSDTVWLKQGWSPFDRDWYYFQTQGSEIMSYGFFVNLEQPDSEKLFRDRAHMSELGFTTVEPSAANPDGLPIGFTRDGYKDVLGINCAACHNGQVNYKGKRIIVDGGVAHQDFPEFNKRLARALRATLVDQAKFDRFARRILKSDYKPDNILALRRDLKAATDKRSEFVTRQYTNEVVAGHGRLDAFNGIFNRALALTGVPGNRVDATAPTSYPHIWDNSLMDFVQYDGDVSNVGIGSLMRNAGEIVGVYGRIEGVKKLDLKAGYPSSIRMHDLVDIEETLKRLVSPKWPDFFPSIDPDKSAEGKELYAQNCAQCHQVIDSRDPNRRIVRPFYKAELIGTDTARLKAVGLVKPMGVFEGRMVQFSKGRKFKANDYVVDLLNHIQDGAAQASLTPELAARVAASAPFKVNHKKTGKFDPSTEKEPFKEFWAYGARPLNGIWATAPYLNNGSIPNLYQLLLPPEKRVKKFYVKSREFDPVNVGFKSEWVPGASMIDTTKPGNRNTGHEFGTKLSDAERNALIEYLKTL